MTDASAPPQDDDDIRSTATPEAPAAERLNPEDGPRTFGDLTIKIGLAIFAFLLGLLATLIQELYFTPKREATIAQYAKPIISLGPDVPTQIRDNISIGANFISRVYVTITNTGTLPIEKFNSLVVFYPDSTVIKKSKNTQTSPSREVPYSHDDSNTKSNEVRIQRHYAHFEASYYDGFLSICADAIARRGFYLRRW